jgi:hypothetical protein
VTGAADSRLFNGGLCRVQVATARDHGCGLLETGDRLRVLAGEGHAALSNAEVTKLRDGADEWLDERELELWQRRGDSGNERRMARGQQMIRRYGRRCYTSREDRDDTLTVATDLMADVMHAAKAHGVDPYDLVAKVGRTYEGDLSEEDVAA